MRNTIILSVFLLIFQSSLCFGEAPAAVSQYVDSLVSKVSTMLDNGSLSEGEKISQSKSLLSLNLDFAWMAKRVLGRNSVSPEQQASFEAVYKDYMIRSYSSLVKNYKGQKATVTDVKSAGEGYIVKTTVSKDGQNPIRADYLIHSAGGGYKVADIITEGISLIKTHTDEFSSIISNQGVDGLISTLKNKQ